MPAMELRASRGNGGTSAATVVLALALLVGCGGGPAITAPGDASLDPANGPSSSAPADGSAAPQLTDPAAIAEALWDPERVDVGVRSMLAGLGVTVVDAGGGTLQAGSGSLGQLRLGEAEIDGLVAMGREDTAALLEGRVPVTLGTLAEALVGVMPGTTPDQVLAAYAEAYGGAPGDLVGETLAGRPIEPATPVTRVHLWLLLIDGLIGRDGAAAAARPAVLRASLAGLTGGPMPGRLPVAAAPAAQVVLPPVQSPGDMSAVEFGLALAHLPLVLSTLQLELAIQPASAHEGHGGPGPNVSIEVRYRGGAAPLLGPLTGRPFLVPRSGLDGVPVTFEIGDRALLEAHGTLASQLLTPISTDAQGVARLDYQVRQEPANGQGKIASGVSPIWAVIGARDLLQGAYAVVDPTLLGFAWGERRLVATLAIEWHEDAPSPSPGLAVGEYRISLRGPKQGAGDYAGTAEFLCIGTPQGSATSWTATARVMANGITSINVSDDPLGRDVVSVETQGQSELGPWFASADSATTDASVSVLPREGGVEFRATGTIVDSDGTTYTIDVALACVPL
jgi:hypothetical protein